MFTFQNFTWFTKNIFAAHGSGVFVLVDRSSYLGFRNRENSVQTVCEEAAAAAAEATLQFCCRWCGVVETDAGQLSRLPTGWWWRRVDDGGDEYRTKSPRLHTPLAVMEKLRSRYSSSTGPSGRGTFPKLGWNTWRRSFKLVAMVSTRCLVYAV